MKLSELIVVLGLDNKQYKQMLKQTETETAKSMDVVVKAVRKTARDFQQIGKSLSLFITLPVVLLGRSMINMAMDTVESENLFEVSMGNMAKAARDWSVEVSKALGLNQYEVRRNIGTLNVMLGSMGLGEQAAFDMAKGLTQLAYDISSFYNLKPEEAFDKLRAGIVGETEPLRRLGVVVLEGTVKQYAYKNGIAAVGSELNEQQKILARYGLIMSQTAKAQGDLARTMDSPANKARRTKAQYEELAATIGTQLLPVVQKFIGTLSFLLTAFKLLPNPVQMVFVALMGLLAALGPLMLAFSWTILTLPKMVAGFKALQIATKAGLAIQSLKNAILGLSVAMMTNPVAATIALIAGALLTLAFTTGFAQKWIGVLTQKFKTFFGTLSGQTQTVENLGDAYGDLSGDLKAYTAATAAASKANDKFLASFDEVYQAAENVSGELDTPTMESPAMPVMGDFLEGLDVPDPGTSKLAGFWNGIKDIAAGAWTKIKDGFSAAWQFISDNAIAAWSGISDFFSGIWQWISGIAGIVWTAIQNALIASWQFTKDSAVAIWTGLGAFFSTIWQFLSNAGIATWNVLSGAIIAAWNWLAATVTVITTGFVTAIVTAFTWLYDHNYYFQALVDAIIAAWNWLQAQSMIIWAAITQFLQASWTALSNLAATVWGAITTTLTAAWTNISALASTIWGAIITFLSEKWAGISALASTIWAAISQSIITAFNLARDGVTTAANAIWTAITTAWNAIASYLTSLGANIWQAIIAPFNQARSMVLGIVAEAWNWGRQLIGNIVDGITSTIGRVREAAAGVANAVKGFLGFHSPAEEGPGAEADQWMPNLLGMMAKGIDENIPKLKESLASVFAMPLTSSPALTGAGGGTGGSSGAFDYEQMAVAVASALQGANLVARIDTSRPQMVNLERTLKDARVYEQSRLGSG